jgi:hypothetical protein
MKQATFQLNEKTDEKIQEVKLKEDTKNSIDFVEITSSNKSKKPIKKVENIYYF